MTASWPGCWLKSEMRLPWGVRRRLHRATSSAASHRQHPVRSPPPSRPNDAAALSIGRTHRQRAFAFRTLCGHSNRNSRRSPFQRPIWCKVVRHRHAPAARSRQARATGDTCDRGAISTLRFGIWPSGGCGRNAAAGRPAARCLLPGLWPPAGWVALVDAAAAISARGRTDAPGDWRIAIVLPGPATKSGL